MKVLLRIVIRELRSHTCSKARYDQKSGMEMKRAMRPARCFLETPGEPHAVSRNGSATRPAKLLALLLAEKGKPLTTAVTPS